MLCQISFFLFSLIISLWKLASSIFSVALLISDHCADSKECGSWSSRREGVHGCGPWTITLEDSFGSSILSSDRLKISPRSKKHAKTSPRIVSRRSTAQIYLCGCRYMSKHIHCRRQCICVHLYVLLCRWVLIYSIRSQLWWFWRELI